MQRDEIFDFLQLFALIIPYLGHISQAHDDVPPHARIALHPRLFRPARNMTIETDVSHSTVPSYMPRECSNLDQASAQNIVRGLLRAVSAWSWRNAALFETSSSKDTGSNPFTSTPALSIRDRRMISGQ